MPQLASQRADDDAEHEQQAASSSSSEVGRHRVPVADPAPVAGLLRHARVDLAVVVDVAVRLQVGVRVVFFVFAFAGLVLGGVGDGGFAFSRGCGEVFCDLLGVFALADVAPVGDVDEAARGRGRRERC